MTKKISVGIGKKARYIEVPFEVKEYSEDGEYYSFKGYASTFGNVDHGGDMVVSGAFKECLDKLSAKGKKLPVLWHHDMSLPLGVYDVMREDSKGLYVEGRMPKADAMVRDRVMPQMKIGSVGSMSIGYFTQDYEWDKDIRRLKKIELFEVSLVSIPMNSEAIITEAKSAVPFQNLPLADNDMAWDGDAARARVKEFTEAGDTPNSEYRKAFLWYDDESPDNYGSYKLPIADVVNGQLRAIPRGIFAAAAAVRGARGGVDIPESDMPAVIRNINRYYDKMGMESPFQESSSFRLDDFKSLSERDLEVLLRDGVVFSQKTAKLIISSLKMAGHRDDDRTQREAEEMKQLLQSLTNLNNSLGV